VEGKSKLSHTTPYTASPEKDHRCRDVASVVTGKKLCVSGWFVAGKKNSMLLKT
jgi:hypothetical protein